MVRRIVRRFRLLSIVVALSLSLSPCLAAQQWQAGVATASITPGESMWMSGYGSRNRPSEGKLTELWAKALVLQDGADQRAVLITLDLVGIDRDLAGRICTSLAERHRLQRRQIAICCSHTHTGPVVGRNLAPLHYLQISPVQQKQVDDYAELLHGRVVAMVGRALQSLAPCTVAAGSGRATFGVNRRENRPEGDVPALRAAGTLRGPVDHDVPVLAVRTAAGKLRCVVFGYACHATVLSFYQWSGDYPGFAQADLQERHPECIAMFWAGCGADQNPLPRRTVELAKNYGRQLADAVDAALPSLRPLPAGMNLAYQEIALPLAKLPTRPELQAAAESKDRYESARAKMLLQQIDAGRPLQPTYPYPIQTWRLGDRIHWVFLGGEVVVDYALRLKSEGSQADTWVAGYANDVMAYIPSRRVLREGGYEGGGSMVYYGLPAHWAPELEEAIVDAAKKK